MFKLRGRRPPALGAESFSLLSVYAWFALSPPPAPPPPQDTFTIQHSKRKQHWGHFLNIGRQIVFSEMGKVKSK